MEAVVKTGREKKAVSLTDITKPECGPDEVLLRIEAAGVCGSDVGAYLAKPEYDYMSVPAVLGHECAGVVESVGDRVEGISLGDRVVLKPGSPCGSCFHCRTGEPNNCPNREPAVDEGGFAPYTTASPEQIISVPDGVSMRRAAITEPLAVTHRAVITAGEVSPGDSVLVQGPGPMGAFSALLAESAGAEVVVTGLPSDADRLALLSDIGVETAENPLADEQAAREFVSERTDRGGFDVTIDATGAAPAVQDSIAATRNGGRVVALGIVSQNVDVDLAALVRSEIDIVTSHGTVVEDFIRVLALLEQQDELPVDHLIDTRFDLSDPTAAFESFIEAETIKPVFEFHEPME
jgi:L-iditol 2-dehydrogenase